MTDALHAGGGIACFTRSYDVAWLKAHPGQTVRQVTLALSDEFGPDEPTLRLRFADARRTLYGSGACFWKDGDINRGVQNDILDARFKPTSGAWCHMYTDITGGSAEEGAEFPIDWRGAKTIDIYLPGSLAMWTSYDIRSTANWHDIKSADQIIRLNRAPAEACQTLVTKFAPAEEPAEGSAQEIEAEIERLREEDAAAFDAGDYARAAKASAQILKLTAKGSGEIPTDYAQALHDHAINLSYLDRFAEAELLTRRALALRTEVLGEKHPDTLTSLHNVASILKALGRPAEAEPLFRRALVLRTEVLGEEFPDSLDSLHELAFALHNLGRSAEAEPLNRRAFKLRTEVLGEKHTDTLTSLHNLASNLIDLGRSGEAEPLLRVVLSSSTEVLGEKHPDTLASLHQLARSLQALGRAAEAETLHRRALALRTEVLGINHPDTLASLRELALTLLQHGHSAKAELLDRPSPSQRP